MLRRRLVTPAALALAVAGAPRAETLYVEARLVLPGGAEAIPEGKIVIVDGTIKEVGRDVKRPAFSRRVDAHELVVTPGFVVPVTRIGMPAPPSPRRGRSRGVQVATDPKAKAAEEFNPLRWEYELLLHQGVTTIGLLPASAATGFQGQVSAVSTLADGAEDVTLADEAAVLLSVSAHGPWREAIAGALSASRKKSKKPGKTGAGAGKGRTARGKAAPARDQAAPAGRRGRGKPAKEDPLQRVLGRDQPLIAAVGGGADWLALTDVVPTEDVDLVVLDGGRLHELVDELAEARVRVVTWPALVNRFRTRMPVNRAAEYERAGIPYAFRLPFDSPRGAAVLRDAVIEMIRTGCSERAALDALTTQAAAVLGLSEKVGQVAEGRRADLLFWTGSPFDPTARLVRVLVAGEDVPLPPSVAEEPGAEGDA